MGYHTIGLLAIGKSALGHSSGFDVKVGKDDPGPQRMRACSPVAGMDMAWGMAAREVVGLARDQGVGGEQQQSLTRTRPTLCRRGVTASQRSFGRSRVGLRSGVWLRGRASHIHGPRPQPKAPIHVCFGTDLKCPPLSAPLR